MYIISEGTKFDVKIGEVTVNGKTIIIDGQIIDEIGIIGYNLGKKLLPEKDYQDFEDMAENAGEPLIAKYNPEDFTLEFEVSGCFYTFAIFHEDEK